MNKKTITSAFDYIALKLKVLVKEKENDRRKLEVTATELKDKATKLAVIAKEKEEVKNKLEGTAEELENKAQALANTAKDKESIRRKLEVTATKLKDKATKLAVIAKEKEEVRRKFAVTATELKESRETLERKVIERTKDLAHAKARNDAFLESIGEGLVVVDKEGNIIYINKSFEDLLGWKELEVIGKNMVEIVPTEDVVGKVQFKERVLSQVLSGDKFVADLTNPFYFIRKDKSRFPVSIVVTPVVLDGKIVGAVETFRDITKEKEVDHAKSEFVSLASHQLRTPLGIMKWYLEALGQEDYLKKSPVTVQNYFDEIQKSNERVLDLVRDLLSVSRIDQGRVKDVPVLVDPTKIVKEVIKQMQIAANSKKVTLILTIQDKNIPPINIDILRFHQVIENLVINAIEYSLAADSINVNLTKAGNNLLISVKDTGMGISKVDQKNLFTKFFRTEKAVGYNPEGSGLGLYVVKSYLDGWGGKVSVESTEGKGSTFTISLPISKKQDTLNRELK